MRDRVSIYSAICLVIALMSMSPGVKSAEDCAAITSNIKRLECFDKLSNTPSFVRQESEQAKEVVIPEMLAKAWDVERLREENYFGPLVKKIDYDDGSEREDVLMTIPAIGAYGVRPLLIAACVNDITRLYLGFSQPLKSPSVKLALLDNDMRIMYGLHWRVVGAGHLLSAGHGVESIQAIREMFAHLRVQVSADSSVVDGLRFDIKGMKKIIRSLRSACGW